MRVTEKAPPPPDLTVRVLLLKEEEKVIVLIINTLTISSSLREGWPKAGVVNYLTTFSQASAIS